MNILQLSKSLSYPPTSGGEVRTWKTAEKLAEIGDLWVAARSAGPLDLPAGITSIQLRTPLLARRIREELWYALFLLSADHPLARLTSRRVAAEISEATTGVAFDVVVSESPQTIGAARLLADEHDARLVLNKQNAYYDYLDQYLSGYPAFVRRRAVANLRRYEQRAIDEAWATVFTGESDRAAFDVGVGTRTVLVPNGCEYEQIRGRGDPDAVAETLGLDPDRLTCLFVGSYDYGPNEAAARTIIDDLAPEFPEAQFLLVGRNPPEIPADSTNVLAPGFVDDLPGTLAFADLALCPLPKGSGTKLKMLDYLAAGLPIVTTTVGAQGLPIVDGRNALIRDTVSGMIDAIRAITASDSLREELAASAAELGRAYDWREVTRAYDDLLADIG